MREKFRNISVVAAIGFAACVFGYLFFIGWLAQQDRLEILVYLPAFITLLGFFYAIFRAIPALEDFWRVKRSSINTDDPFFVYISIALWCAAVNLIFIALAYIKTDGESFIKTISYFVGAHTDSQHYMYVAEKWYDQSNSAFSSYIVFMPLYPVLTRMVSYLFRNLVFCGYIVSNVFMILSGILFYRLSSLFLEGRELKYAVKFLCIFPSAFFLLTPLPQSLFLFLSLACIYYTLLQDYKMVFLSCFLVVLTRLEGIALIIPIACEMGYAYRKKSLVQKVNKKQALKDTVCLVSFPLAFLVYLSINQMVYGNCLQFLIYAKEVWHNADYFADNLVSGAALYNMLPFLTALLLSIYGANKIRPSLTLYSLAYFVALLSGAFVMNSTSSLACLFPLAYVAAGIAFKNKKYNAAITAAYFVIYIFCLHQFVLQYIT